MSTRNKMQFYISLNVNLSVFEWQCQFNKIITNRKFISKQIFFGIGHILTMQKEDCNLNVHALKYLDMHLNIKG